MELSERRKKILQIVVDDYIEDIKPISSQRIQQKYMQKISSATIRSELAALEEMGFLAHPHTSAGKIPLPKAYRYYVDKLMDRGKLSDEEINYINEHFNRNITETETLIKNAAKVISDITNYAALGVERVSKDEVIDNIKLVPLSSNTVLLIVVTPTKVLKDSIIDIQNPIDEMYIETGAEILRNIFCGKKISQAMNECVDEYIGIEFARYRQLIKSILEVLKNYIELNKNRVFTEGAVKLLSHPEFSDIEKARKFLSIIDSEDKLIEMIKQGGAGSVEFSVRIGSDEEYEDFSLVTANYTLKGSTIGSAGVIGPIRMNYRKVISVLECVKRSIEEIIK